MSRFGDHIQKLGARLSRRKQERANEETAAPERLKQANRRLTRQLEQANKKIAMLQARLAKRQLGDEIEGIKPENIVWVFGTARTGSTWLSSMMKTLRDHDRWNEPLIGDLFGSFYYEQRELKHDRTNFILGSAYRETWLSSIRSFVLDGATARYPEVAEKGGYLIIKEPHGSIGAPLLVEALPESRMIFLVRDPRDVAASGLHVTFVRTGVSAERRQRAEEQPQGMVKGRAERYLREINRTKEAYEAHEGRKVLVRYEDLKSDTLGTIRHIYSALEIPVDEGELAKAVEKHTLENIPEDKKGPGTVRRRGTSGGWREDLTPEQVEIVERITAPLLEEFYA